MREHTLWPLLLLTVCFIRPSCTCQVCCKGDSIEGIYDSLKECAVISKSAGGIGISIHNIRATGGQQRQALERCDGAIALEHEQHFDIAAPCICSMPCFCSLRGLAICHTLLL